MATIRVTSSSALASALRSASSGDTIALASGHYTLSSGTSKALTITSTEGAVFDSIDLSRASNLTIDHVDFNGGDGVKNAFRIWGSDNITIKNGDMEGVASGTGQGRGIFVQNSTDVTVSNMTIHGFQFGAYLDNADGVVLRNNTFTNISLDGINGGDLQGASFLNNSISLAVPKGVKHTDGIQLWNVAGRTPSSDVTIEGNYIRTNNLQSHGIYAMNEQAVGGGGSSSFYQHVTINGNTIVSGDGLGLSWGQTHHLDIQGNIVLRDSSLPADKAVPSIRVQTASTDVSVTGNVNHKAPLATDNAWQTVNHSSSDWTISNNPIIRVGASLADAQALLASIGGGSAAAKAAPMAAAMAAVEHSDGDVFRFDAVGRTDVVRGFGDGDRIELHGFAAGSFHGAGLDIGEGGGAVTIGGLDDLRALDAASGAVRVHAGSNDALVIDIGQGEEHHAIRLAGLAHDYF